MALTSAIAQTKTNEPLSKDMLAGALSKIVLALLLYYADALLPIHVIHSRLTPHTLHTLQTTHYTLQTKVFFSMTRPNT
jgi:hypothetical protein